MGERMRTFDWASTPLGCPDQWPQSLKTCVRIMLTSRQPIWIGWGEQLIFMYNDAYRPIIGGRHPHALGQPTSVIWHEVWDVIGPMLTTAMRGDRGTYVEAQLLIMERNGYEEETYYTFSYSPVPDDAGNTGGIICANTDDTRRVIGERQTALLRDIAAKSSEARTAEDACRLAAKAIDENPRDVPLALVYLIDAGDPSRAVLTAVSGLYAQRASPAPWIVATDGAFFPEAVAQSEDATFRLLDLPSSFGASLAGRWRRPPTRAAVLPIAAQGDSHPAGVLIAGINPLRQIDDDYRRFLKLVASQISAGIGNAQAFDAQRERADALLALDRAKTAFFSNVSHEFRTPLTLLLAPAEEALTDQHTTTANRERLGIVHRNGLRLLKLVNSLLDFSRIEAGRMQAIYEPTDLAAYTAEVASSFRSAVERADLRLVVEGGALPEPVFIDRDMWEKVVLNLLSNAFKHTFEGEIRVTVDSDDHRARLVVRDSGVGIPSDQLARIFDRFHRVPNARSRTHEGTGIGLALVQELVKLQGGTIDVESTPGCGTAFTVAIPFGTAHLPPDRVTREPHREHDLERTVSVTATYVEEALRWLPTDTSAPDRDAAASPASADPVVQHPTVVVADDNGDMREYVTRLLRERGMRVVPVSNGAEALDAIRIARPNVVLSDVMMPELDGFQLLRAVRADQRVASVPFILLSARAGEEARVEGLHAGADDYLVKPFSAKELLSRVDSQVRRARDLAHERRRADDEQRLRVAIESERARFRSLFVQAPAAIAVLRGPDHVFEIANQAYLAMVGNRPVLGKPVHEAIPDLVGQGVYEAFDTVYETGRPFAASEFRAEFDADNDGVAEEHFYNFVCQPIRGSEDTVEALFFHAVEVTDLVRARREAERTRADAEEANRAKSDFLAAMSHELRTPLNAIAGHAELLDMGIHGPVTAGQHEALGRIQRSEAHLLSLINDILNFAKLEAGRVEYQLDDVRPWEVVQEVLTMVHPMLVGRQLTSEVRVSREVVARGDREKIKQIVLNLLSNAMKFTDAGGHIEIDTPRRATGDTPDGVVLLRVWDTGIGIPRDRQDIVFDPFVQIHRKLTHSTEGTGLGLAISRDLARGMGGDLRVRSTEGGGSAFTLSLQSAARAGND